MASGIRNLSWLLALTSTVHVRVGVAFQDRSWLCPVIPDLLSGTHINMEQWSFMSTAEVLIPVLYGATPPPPLAMAVTQPPSESIANIQMNPRVDPHNGGYPRTPWAGSYGGINNPLVCYGGANNNSRCYARVAEVTTPFFAWSVERTLTTWRGGLISKLVMPAVFWDTSIEVYDCHNNKIGTVVWNFHLFEVIFMGNYFPNSKVLDPNGNHVATIVQSSGKSFWSNMFTLQKLLTIADTQGVPMIRMQHRKKPVWAWPFKIMTQVTIEKAVMGQTLSPPAMEPQFLALLFTNAMMGGLFGSRFGPLWGLVYAWICIGCSCCCCCVCCFAGCCRRKTKVVVVVPVNTGEDKSPLLDDTEMGESEGPQLSRPMFACCSRPGGRPIATLPAAPPAMA